MRCNCQGVIPRGQVYTWPIGPSWTTSSERVAVLEDSADIRGMCVKICELLCVAGWICVWEPVCWGWGRAPLLGHLASPFREGRGEQIHRFWEWQEEGVWGSRPLFKKE